MTRINCDVCGKELERGEYPPIMYKKTYFDIRYELCIECVKVLNRKCKELFEDNAKTMLKEFPIK